MIHNIIVYSFKGNVIHEEKRNFHIFQTNEINKELIAKFPLCYYIVIETKTESGKTINKFHNKNYSAKI